MDHQEYLKKIALIFLAVSVPVALMVTLFSSWQVGIVFGFLFGIFTSFHFARNLQTETFEINASNKDKRKGLPWYEGEISSYMRDLRWILLVDKKEVKVWKPRGQGQVMGEEFKMEVTPYSITISGSRGTVRIVKSILDLHKIFL